MGEANYYLKAHFKPSDDLDAIKAKLAAFFAEGNEAQDWWQAHRSSAPSAFWPEFTKRFPMVTKYLEQQTKPRIVGGDCNNALSGLLDLVNEDDAIAFELPDDGTFRYAAQVWHFADWDPLAAFLRMEFGAQEVNWLSDEYLSPWDSLT